MKTYQSKTKETKKNFFKRHKYAIAITLSVLAIALVITLSVVFTLPDKKPVGGVVVEPPSVAVDNKPTIVAP